MSKDLVKIFEAFVNGDEARAATLLKKNILETAAEINHRLENTSEDIEEMERDMGDDLTNEISDDKEEIKSEEMYGEAEGDDIDHDVAVVDVADDMVDGDEDILDLDTDDTDNEVHIEDFADVEDELEKVNDKVEDLEDGMAEFEALKAEFDALQNKEEVEHDEDMNGDGVIGDDIAADADLGSIDMEDNTDHIGESVELTKVSVDIKDKTGDAKSPVPTQKDKLNLGGKPVVVKGTKHEDFNREDMKVDQVTKHDNTVSKASDAIVKANNSLKKM